MRCTGPAGERESNHLERADAYRACEDDRDRTEHRERQVAGARRFGTLRANLTDEEIRSQIDHHYRADPTLADEALRGWLEAREPIPR